MSEKISILFAGDFCATNPCDIKISEDLMLLFDSCDLKVLNFEGPLATDTFSAPNKTVLKQSDESPEWCINNGFNPICLANNHMRDYGEKGLVKTKSVFDSVTTLGAGTWEEAYQVKFVKCKGKIIGFIALSSADLASLQDHWTDSQKLGCAWINNPSVNRIIAESKQRCDYLCVITHAGVEHMKVPLPEWRDRYKELVDCGADVIIGSHPHVIQGIEVYKGHPIVYSLGNFYFDYFNNYGKPDSWDEGLIIKLSIDSSGKLSTIPYFTRKTNNSLVIDTEDRRVEFERLCNLFDDDAQYLEVVNKEVIRLFPKYKQWLLCGFGAIDANRQTLREKIGVIKRLIVGNSPNYAVAMHQLREESTRYLLTRALRIKSNNR